MSTSSITITSLTATPTLRGNKLAAVVSAIGPAANLPNLQIDVVEFWASTTNDFTTAALVVSGYPEAIHQGLIEEQTYYYWAKAKAVNGSYGAVYPASATAGVVCTALGTTGILFGGLANGKIVATVSANALTVAVKNAAGNDPDSTATGTVFVAFPNATAANGSYQIRQITAALSQVISSGSTLGVAASNVPFRLWVLLFDDGGTLRLGIIKCIDVNRYRIFPISGRVMSATSEGGAGAADSAGVVYSNATITSKPFRILGYLEWSSGLATDGTWNVAPDIIRLHGIGDPRPGDVLQEHKIITANTLVNDTTTIPFDNTPPQSTGEGTELTVWALSMTPTAIANILDYHAEVSVSNHTGSLHMIGAVFRDSEANAYASDAVKINTADDIARLFIDNRFFPDDLNSHTYKIRIGGSSAGSWTVNGVNNAGKFGGGLETFASVKELMV